MPARYAPLPNNNEDADRELNAAFDGDDDDDDDENTPLNPVHARQEVTTTISSSSAPIAITHESSGSYDFERDYDLRE
ncbi:hypothetical protein V5O48_016340 [Marasmius crinis-equi]|uniref:Uncharacterized protein n=1 Tax=Marasmius crinis-equi TaxID=585013 RepID=A0ABR3ERY8_9AGAR